MFGISPGVGCVGILQLSANQTTNLATGNRVQFDTPLLSSGAAVLVTSGADTGILNLGSPGRYLLLGSPVATGTSATAVLQWYNLTSGTFFGSRWEIPGSSFALSSSLATLSTVAMGFISISAGTASVPVELRIVSGGGTFTNWTTNSWAFLMRM